MASISKPRRIVAFDLGANLGIADLIISGAGLFSINSKAVKLKSKDVGKRLIEFDKVIRRHTSMCTEVVVEKPVGGFHSAQVALFGYLAILKKWAAEQDIKVYEYVPTSVKMFATRNGRASKDDMLRAANRFLNIKTIKDHNEADAVCLLHLHLKKSGISEKR